MRTLLLDNTYFPIKIVSWQRAMILLLTGRAEMVVEYPDIQIKTVNQSFSLPKILKLNSRHLSEKTPKFTRLNVYLRDRFTCQYCANLFGTHQLTFDHVIPISRGGPTTWENIVTACAQCNTRKGNKTPKEANMALLRHPRPPGWSPTLCLKIKEGDPVEWFEWFPKSRELAS